MNIEKIIPVWREAAEDLHIKISAPFIFHTPDNKEIYFPILIESFGKSSGTLIFSLNDTEGFKAGSQYGYYCAATAVSSYSTYEKNFFIATLNDWGYFGEAAEQPAWYTGEAWSM